MGPGNVSDNGTLVSINLTSKNVTGLSALGLYDIGITNETEYVSIAVNNGTVQVDATPPEFVDNSPIIGTTGDTYTFNVSVTDNIDNADELTVKVNWSHESLGGNESMIHVGGNYFEKTVILDTSAILMLFEFSIDLEDELIKLLGRFHILVPSPIIEELKLLSKHGNGKKVNLLKNN